MVPVYTSSDDTTPQALAKRGYPVASSIEELMLAKDQSLVVEYVPGITIDVRGERALVDLLDDDSNDDTEDEVYREHSPSKSSFEMYHDPEPNSDDNNHNERDSEQRNVSSQELPLPTLGEREAPRSSVDGQTSDSQISTERALLEAHATRHTAPPSSPPLHRIENENQRQRSSSAGPSRKRDRADTPNIVKRARSRKNSEEPEAPVKVEQLDDETRAQLMNIMANHLAFSRLSSTPLSLIKKSHAALGAVAKCLLRQMLSDVHCIGVIQRQGKDAAGMPLEEEYYYMPENDDDQHRRLLVEQSRGHASLRACRRTHKQVSH
jgi:hypothetical protein